MPSWQVVPEEAWDDIRLGLGQRAQLDIRGQWPGTDPWYAGSYVQLVYNRYRGQGWVPVDWWWREPGQVLTVEVMGVQDTAGAPASWQGGNQQAVAWWVGPLLLTIAAAFLALRIEGVIEEIRIARQEAPLSTRLWPWALLVTAGVLAWRYREVLSRGP